MLDYVVSCMAFEGANFTLRVSYEPPNITKVANVACCAGHLTLAEMAAACHTSYILIKTMKRESYGY